MGCCFSAANTNYAGDDMPTAKVVLMDGSLLEFSAAVRVSQVLGLDGHSGFICNSDSLCYDDYIQALNPSELVVPGQLYFVMPIDMLKHVVSGADMAALAVKACSAIEVATKSKPNRGGVRIMPLAGEAEDEDNGDYSRFNEFSVGVTSSTRKWTTKTRNMSAAPLPVKRGGRPFEVKLSAIEEVAE